MKQNLVTTSLLSALLMVFSIVADMAFAQALPTWSGSFTDQHNNQRYTFTMVGGDPSTTGTTTIPVYLVPVKVVFQKSTCQSGQYVFDPNTVLSNGETAVNNTISSPIFTGITNFPEGNGSAIQYIDAFQRGNFWGAVQGNQAYHLTLGPPTIVAEQTITVPLMYGDALDRNNAGTNNAGTDGTDPISFLPKRAASN
jgi:hypothetical protein